MKRLVLGSSDNGSWLAQHLTCAFHAPDPNGLGVKGISKVPQPIGNEQWDEIINVGPNRLYTGNQMPIGFAVLSETLEDPSLSRALLMGQGLTVSNELPTIALASWWDRGWLGQDALIYEQWPMMNRNLGAIGPYPQGITATVNTSDIFADGLTKLEGLLVNYAGPVFTRWHVDSRAVAIINLQLDFADGVWETLLELQDGNLLDDPMNLRTGRTAVGVLVSLAPYPFGSPRPFIAIQTEEGGRKHFKLRDVHEVNNALVTNGSTGAAFYATAWGDSASSPDDCAREARMRVYRSLRSVYVPELQYRTDVSTLSHQAFASLNRL